MYGTKDLSRQAGWSFCIHWWFVCPFISPVYYFSVIYSPLKKKKKTLLSSPTTIARYNKCLPGTIKAATFQGKAIENSIILDNCSCSKQNKYWLKYLYIIWFRQTASLLISEVWQISQESRFFILSRMLQFDALICVLKKGRVHNSKLWHANESSV